MTPSRIPSLLLALLLTACATAPASKNAPNASTSAGTPPPPGHSRVGASVVWRVLVDGGRGGMTLVREEVLSEHDGETEVLTTEAHDPQQTKQERLVRIGPWEGGTGPSGERVRYEKLEHDARRPLTRAEGEALLARIEGQLQPPLPQGTPVDVTTTATTDHAGTTGTLQCRTEQGRYPGSDPSKDLSYAKSTCEGEGFPWHDGFARLWRTQSGEELWKRELFDGKAPGSFVCPATLREAAALKLRCGTGLRKERGCVYDGTWCGCMPARTCSGGAAHDPSMEPQRWQCVPPNAPNPCGSGPPPP